MCYRQPKAPFLSLRQPKRVIQPNLFAFVMLLSWPLVVWQLYSRLDAGRALIWTVLGGYLILPPLLKFDFPVVPDLDKDTLPAVSALVITALKLRERLSFWPEGRLGRLLVVMFCASPFFTVLTNTDAVGPLPGMRLYDSAAAVANQAIFALPMFLARRDLATPQAMRTLLAALVAAGLAYSLPMLIEARLSPQVNVWVYGYFQHDFFQTIRFGGYRPVVFLPHGLWVAFFALMCLAASAVFLREGPAERRPRQLAVFLWLGLMLYICKSFGPAAYALVMLPLILFASTRLQIAVAAAAVALVLAYPLLRGLHLVPLDAIVDFFRSLSPDRAWSLEFRFRNEEALLARASERPLFGWGGYARNFLHDAAGQPTGIADGGWIIQIGIYGWLGYLAEFGLLALPIWLLAREGLRRDGPPLSPYAAGLALIFAFNLLDLLPNFTLVPVSWMIGGALLGHAEALQRARAAGTQAAARARPPRTVI